MWRDTVAHERVKVPSMGRKMMAAAAVQSTQKVARVRYPACGNGLVFKDIATWDDLMVNYKKPRFIFSRVRLCTFTITRFTVLERKMRLQVSSN